MLRRRMTFLLPALALATLSSPLAAQSARIIFSLQWMEVDSVTNTPVSNPNGILEPGEAARIMLSAAFTPAVGQPVNTGTMAGLGTAFVTVHTGSSSGSWSHVATAAGFHPQPFPLITPTQYLGAGGYQYGTGHWMPDPSNPVESLWSAAWMPASYQPGEVSVGMQWVSSLWPQVWVHLGTDPTTGFPILNLADAGFLHQPFPSLQIPVIPAPAGGTLLIGGLMLTAARRRRCAESGSQRC